MQRHFITQPDNMQTRRPRPASWTEPHGVVVRMVAVSSGFFNPQLCFLIELFREGYLWIVRPLLIDRTTTRSPASIRDIGVTTIIRA